MHALYTLTKDELNYEFLDNLKKMITGNEIQISIESYDDTQYLMKSEKNREHLAKALYNVDNNINIVEVPFEDILKEANEEN
ncbi:MAG: hypothetical protein WCT77_01405 [Bacteroidota bacterium]